MDISTTLSSLKKLQEDEISTPLKPQLVLLFWGRGAGIWWRPPFYGHTADKGIQGTDGMWWLDWEGGQIKFRKTHACSSCVGKIQAMVQGRDKPLSKVHKWSRLSKVA
jgi:hypothetical protein